MQLNWGEKWLLVQKVLIFPQSAGSPTEPLKNKFVESVDINLFLPSHNEFFAMDRRERVMILDNRAKQEFSN